ncbi:MAG: LamG domain-containing protein [Candidatus Pacebacteria bacterium]|nr:LamG domain-containing protein [Candidatus Paceibacterota bacterium]
MNKSFTLIEILVVIVIIGILSAFIIVSMAGVSSKATIAKGQAFSNSLKNSLMLNLVSEWKFDELSTATTGATISDSWGENNGTLTTNDANDKLAAGSECVSGKCLYFDGTDDYIAYGSPSSLIITKFLTMEAWVKQTRDAQPAQYIAGNDRDGGTPVGGYDIHVRSNWLFYGCVWRKSTSTRACVNGTAVPENTWHYVVSTFDGQQLKVYQNGVQSGTTPVVDEIDNPSQNFIIGCLAYNHPIYYKFNGLIDGIRIYNQAVPASQIQQNYYSGLNKLLISKQIDNREIQERLSQLKQ